MCSIATFLHKLYIRIKAHLQMCSFTNFHRNIYCCWSFENSFFIVLSQKKNFLHHTVFFFTFCFFIFQLYFYLNNVAIAEDHEPESFKKNLSRLDCFLPFVLYFISQLFYDTEINKTLYFDRQKSITLGYFCFSDMWTTKYLLSVHMYMCHFYQCIYLAEVVSFPIPEVWSVEKKRSDK